jgi:hypothetical protein
MHIHTLNTKEHEFFLCQNRYDPYTKEFFKPNDRIVICAGGCKTAFLVDSWKTIKEKHCEQSLTLENIPLENIDFSKKRNLKKQINHAKRIKKIPLFETWKKKYNLVPSFSSKSDFFINQKLVELSIISLCLILSPFVLYQNNLPAGVFKLSLWLSPIVGLYLSKLFRPKWKTNLFLYYMVFNIGMLISFFINSSKLFYFFQSFNFWSGLLIAITNIIYRIKGSLLTNRTLIFR